MRKYFLFFTVFTLNILTSFSQDVTATRKKHFNLSKSSLAIDGYDPVAYFTDQKAIKGKKEYAANHQGAVYYFANAGNKEKFIQSPAVYEPQYGGWCAYAMGKEGEKVSVDPGTFKIINSKLYLFYNRFFNNTLTSWNKDEANLLTKADVNWRKIFK